MPAYMIVTCHITDREAFINGYGKAAAALVARHGGRYLLRAPGGEVLEGDLAPGPSMVISEWPDKAAVHAFWNSPEYREAVKLRENISTCQVVVVEAPSIAEVLNA